MSGKRGEALASLTLHSGHTDGWWGCHISSASQWAPSRVCQPEIVGFLPTPGWESQSLQPHRCGQLAPAPNTVASPHCSFCAPPVRVTIPPQRPPPQPKQNKGHLQQMRAFIYVCIFCSCLGLSQGAIYHHLQLAFCCPSTKLGFSMGSEPRDMKDCSVFSRILYTQYSGGHAPGIKARARWKICRSLS